MRRPFALASFFHGDQLEFPASYVACNGSSPVFHPNNCVDFVKLSFLPLNARFVEDFLNHRFVSICSPYASEF